MTDKVDIIIEWYADGWALTLPDGSRFRWDHNDEDMGTHAIKEMLECIGYTVRVEESY